MSKEPLPYRRNVGIMLVNREGLAWVGRRKDTPDAWQMPQGGIDKGEEPRAAALRELEEEIGTANVAVLAETAGWLRYDFPPELRTKGWMKHYAGQEQKWFLCRFLGADDEIDLETEHPEFDAWKWVPVAELVGLIVPFKRAIYERVVAELGPLVRA
ncbi:RNA pyrophosphohydrolase [Aerophototrophica crusticola]|uniref:RNA pyrophosphohydrolase n=1 Tax=Aerophototrophica crusticola TaxID=1709002 RepID=A0A858R9A0_9PROT|nr:RNA pyrophosphohydrolase [Rhodospirillaceae bacterium B3]